MVADKFWKDLVGLSKKNKAKEIYEMVEARRIELENELEKIVREREKIDEFLQEIKKLRKA